MSTPASTAIHPSDMIPESWVVSEDLVKAGAVKVEHHMEEPSELRADRLSQHLLLVSLIARSQRQVTRIGKQEYDGPGHDNAFFLSAADDQPSFWSWDGLDETMFFSFDPQTLQQVADEGGCVSSREIALKNVVYGQDPQLAWLAKQFQRELRQEGVGGRLFKDSLATLLELHVLRNYTHQPVKIRQSDLGLSSRRLKLVLSYIDEHLSESISIEELAAIAELSKHHFSHMFKQSMGIPPYRYLLLQRIKKAKQYLKQDSLSISDIAAQCGFSDQSHLTRHFTKATGTTPRRFRER